MAAVTDLLARVTRRLFLAICMLLVVAVAIMIFGISESRFVAPAAVLTSGFIGGFVGLQRRLKELTVEDLELMGSSWICTLLSPLVGGVLAFLLYILFLSGLLSGQLFPQFAIDTGQFSANGFGSLFFQHAANYNDYAKLLFWCFVAGFSERFVTDIIGRFEGTAIKSLPQAGSTDSPPSGGGR
jgi:hypothetical protein